MSDGAARESLIPAPSAGVGRRRDSRAAGRGQCESSAPLFAVTVRPALPVCPHRLQEFGSISRFPLSFCQRHRACRAASDSCLRGVVRTAGRGFAHCRARLCGKMPVFVRTDERVFPQGRPRFSAKKTAYMRTVLHICGSLWIIIHVGRFFCRSFSVAEFRLLGGKLSVCKAEWGLA